MKRAGLFVLAIGLATVPAFGQSLDLKKVYGDKYGCINRNGQEVVVDQMLLLKEGVLVTAMSACTIKGTSKAKDGSLVLATLCESGDGQEEATFRIAASKKKKGIFVIHNEDGTPFGEVSLCRK